MDTFFIQGPIPPALVTEILQQYDSSTTTGAHSLFLGRVRADLINGKRISAIDYTAYEEMALQNMHRIAEDISVRYGLTAVQAHHSLGLVKAGGLCLFVCTSSTRRHAAIAACEEMVIQIKAGLPVWGKELFEDETYQWKENK